MGILDILEEETLFPKATDQSFVKKVANNNGTNQKLKKANFRDAATSLKIVHYAGEVSVTRGREWEI